jgi:hypothetical protein
MERYGNLEFTSKKELFKFLSENRDKLIAQKKAVKKESDCSVAIAPVIVHEKTNKDGLGEEDKMRDSLKVVVIINTTNFLDSHNDLHLPGIWTKSIKENKMIMHLQEHEMEFEKIIADGKELKVYTKSFKWSELGYNYYGITEALVFESIILRNRNEYMLEQYANGWVKNHSVGMYYVKMDFAVNDEEYPNEYEAWQKYYPQIANKEVADEKGYFWYVLEAKCCEGSAVPIGSNTATPTLSVGKSMTTCLNCANEFEYNSITEAGMGYVNCPKCGKPVSQKRQPDNTDKNIEPSKDTQIDYSYLIKNLKN